MITSYEDKLLNHVSDWEMKNFRVCYDDQVIFLCGAVVHPSGEKQTSMRGHFYDYCTKNNAELSSKIFLAEKFKQYLKNDHYPDLITFEHDVANISSLIVLFLESSGSIAELGLFCNMKEINRKLLVFVPADEVDGDKKESFIYLGPLSYLTKKINKNAFKVYPKPDKKNEDDYAEHLDIMVEDLIDILPKSRKESDFDKNNTGHIAFLISRIVHLAMPIRLREVYACLKNIGIDNITQADVERLLFLLETLEFISSYRYNILVYYYSEQSRQNLKLGKNKKGITIDEPGMITDITFFINDEKRCNDKKRRLALKGIVGKANGHN